MIKEERKSEEPKMRSTTNIQLASHLFSWLLKPFESAFITTFHLSPKIFHSKFNAHLHSSSLGEAQIGKQCNLLKYFNLWARNDKYQDQEFSSTHLKEIPATKLHVSVNNPRRNFADLEIFDISLKGKQNKIYSFEVTKGSKCCSLIASNKIISLLFKE